MAEPIDDPPDGYEWVFVPYVRHPKTGKIIRPKQAKVFRFLRRKNPGK
jgi:hypothetical protein